MAEERKIKSRERPISPHLQVYKPQITSVLSILHRISTVVMYFAALLFTYVLYREAFGGECKCYAWLTESEEGKVVTKVVLSGFAVSASYWICATIRHLFWDIGKGFELSTAIKTGWLSVITTLALSAYIINYGVL